MADLEAFPDNLDAVVHDALVPHTSDWRWLDEVTPHVTTAVRAWLAEVLLSEATVEAAAISFFHEDANASTSPDPWPEWNGQENAARPWYTTVATAALQAAVEVLGVRGE